MLKKFVRWPILLIFAALIIAALVPVFPLLHSSKSLPAHAVGIVGKPFFSPSLSPRLLRPPKPQARHTTAGVDRTHLPALPLLGGKITRAAQGNVREGALMSAAAAPATTTTLFFDNFESGAPGWTIVGDANGNNLWNIAQNPNALSVPGAVNPLLVSYPDTAGNLPAAYSGTHAWWYGNNPAVDPHPSTASITYMGNEANWPPESSHNGGTSNGANSGSLISPSIDLTAVHNATLTFATWWEIEGLNPAHFDQMYVEISTNGGSSWSALGVLNPTSNPITPVDSPMTNPGGPYAFPFTDNGLDTPASWQVASVNLSAYTGHKVQVRFRFDSVDQTGNGFRGWFIDDVGVSTSSGGVPRIAGISPNVGQAGQSVTISGANFGSHQGTSTVTFSGVNAEIQSWGNYSITAIVPQNIISGPVVVTVKGVQAAVNFIVNAQLNVGPSYASPGGFAPGITGAGFAPNESVAILIDGVNGSLWTTIKADSDGALPDTERYAPHVPYGVHLVLAVGQTSHIIAGAGLFIFPSFTATVSTVAPGDTVNLIGSGFTPFDTAQVQVGFFALDNNDIGSLTCNAIGDCTGQATIPTEPSAPQGPGYLSELDAGSGFSVGSQITFAPGITISPSEAGPGTTLYISGGSFNTGETVQVYMGSASGKLEGAATTDNYGNLSFSFQTPTTVKAGSHIVTVVRNGQTPTTVAAPYTILVPKLISTAGIFYGQSINVQLSGFQAGEIVTLSWNANGGQQLETLDADDTGAWSGSLTPPATPVGVYTVTAKGNSSGLTATSSLAIGPGIWISSNASNPGCTITVNGGGFTPGETVKVYFQTTSHGTVSAPVNSAGQFTASLMLPTHYDPSVTYYVYAKSTTGTDHAKVVFAFTPLHLYVNPQTSYGTTGYLIGSGFAANEKVNLYWGYQQPIQKLIATVTAAADGSFSTTVTVPGEPNLGYINVAAIGLKSQLQTVTQTREGAGFDLQPADAPDGGKVSVKGGSFGPNEQVVLSLNQTTLATATTNSNGGFSTSFIVPTGTTSGSYWLQIVGQSSGITTISSFTVDGTVVLTPGTGPSGTNISVSGSNFESNEQLDINWYDPTSNFSTTLTGITTASDGTFTVTVKAPANLVSGTTYDVIAWSEISTEGEASFVAQ